MKVEFSNSYDQQQNRALEYARKNNIPIKQYLPEGNLIELVDVDPFGQPVYRATSNSGLAISTNVTKLRTGGGLGLNLLGEGLEVGVWDGGPAFEHIEFIDRILTKESGTALAHATHVSGTILASGINLNAMGMAPKAKLHSFDWNNDRAEMIAKAKPDQSGLLFSNHSYSIVLGWNCSNGSCSWQGQTSISDKEDWRFGFYTTLAKDIDNIAFNAPYYSIFWAAGNNRGETTTTGVALYPPDGNQGSGYDCIVQEGTAKNIFTIGAVRKVPSYTSPASVEMSSFSGWGPTDDGRIKPDLVAPGVNIFSTVVDNNYASNNGTSMATPGALGSLSLLQELHSDLNGGEFMRSATLKALAIHTAKEAGQYPGPDYSFGWGLIDAEAAAKVLLTKDNQNIFVKELELANGKTFELMLTPKANTKITATIAWTDPAGNPVGSSLDPTNLMLVNDLDMRILDDANNQQMPWKLNPEDAALGEPAFRGDNFRDNIEKIEFESPEPRSYTLRVSHKGTLSGGSQNFSLIVTYTSVTDPQVAYYWIGGSGDLSDPNHWSLSSGGVSAGAVPDGNNRIIIDENSSLADGGVISMSGNTTIGSLTWLNKSQAGIALNGHTLTIRGSLIISSDKTQVLTPGKILFTGSLNSENTIFTSNNNFSTTDIEIDLTTNMEMSGSLKVRSMRILSGLVNMTGFNLEAKSFEVVTEAGKTLTMTGAKLLQLENLAIHSNALEWISNGATISPASNSIIDLGGRIFNGKLVVENQNVRVLGDNTLSEIILKNELLLDGNNSITKLTIHGNSVLALTAGTIQQLTESTLISATPANPVSIRSTMSKAFLKFAGRFKLCFDNLLITNVDATGDGIINAGLSSVLENSSNWAKDDCENILFPDFQLISNCVDGLVELVDKSAGAIESYKWETNETMATLINANERKGSIIFSKTGTFEVSLTISNSKDSRTFKQLITINPNDLPPNPIIINGFNLFSTQPSPTYAWYRDNTLIPNSNGRSYPFNGEPGLYFVLTKSDLCNRVSNPVLITGLSEPGISSTSINIYPNPAEDIIFIDGLKNKSTVKIQNALGLLVYDNQAEEDLKITTTTWSRGLYFIRIAREKDMYTYKIILK
ncbi:MAG: S8 family serine peptidase [Cyclobacteriaceae bacterium]|nr:S8 family serine peptidase [Cyclobacteriaceae bacterium]